MQDRAKGDVTPPQPLGRLLVVDDDDQLRSMLVRILELEGYEIDQAADAKQATAMFANKRPDLVLLDVVMPNEDGFDFLTRIRRISDVPIILLTGKGRESDRIQGLRLGADDYVVKPFSPGELAARITSVLRRTKPKDETKMLDFGDLCIDLSSRDVVVNGLAIETTAKEFDLLAFLAKSPRQVFTRDQLLEQVWESSSAWQDGATVTEHVRRLRRKIESNPDRPRWVRTVRGVGYRFEP